MASLKAIAAPPVKLFIFALYVLASYVVPKNRRLLAFGGSFQGNARAVYEHLKEHCPGYETPWIAHARYTEVPDQVGYDFVPQWSFRSLWLILRARYLFINHQPSDISLIPPIGRFAIIQLWHGTPIKKILFDMEDWEPAQRKLSAALAILEYRNYHIIVTTSQLAADCLVSAFRVRRKGKIRILGLPRNDALLRAPHERLPGHEAFDSVILYAPTFRDSGELPPILTDPAQRGRLIASLEARNQLLLLKPHRLDKAAYAALDIDSPHVINLCSSDFDVLELFSKVDLLISDYSSIIFDYCLTGMPIAFFPYDLDDYLAKSRDLYFDYHSLIPGPTARDLDGLLTILGDIRPVQGDPEYSARYQEFLDLFHEHKDDQSTRRVLECLGIMDER